jgi:protein-S-isoprenylcysteine O-methyltransferase Ste14
VGGRHRLYLALLANNGVALGAAALQLIPALFAAWMEDHELLARAGPAHEVYLRRTGALLPRRDMPAFLRLLFLGLFSPGA